MKHNKPIVSIVIPIYNAEKYLKETLDSVLNQSFQEIEIICVNDASTDTSELIVKNYAKEDSRIRYVKNLRNLGVIASRNLGITSARSQYILPLDADDKLNKEYVKKAVSIFSKDKNVSVVYCQAEMFGRVNAFWNLPPYNKDDMLLMNHVFCSAFFKKSAWQEYKAYKANMKYGLEDWDFWLNFVEDDKKFFQIKEVLFYYRTHKKSRTNVISHDRDISLKREIRKNHPKLYTYENILHALSARQKHHQKVSKDFFNNISKLFDLIGFVRQRHNIVIDTYGLVGHILDAMIKNARIIDGSIKNEGHKIGSSDILRGVKNITVVLSDFGREEEREKELRKLLDTSNNLILKASDFDIVNPDVFLRDLERLFNVFIFLQDNSLDKYSTFVQSPNKQLYELINAYCILQNIGPVFYHHKAHATKIEFLIQEKSGELESVYSVLSENVC